MSDENKNWNLYLLENEINNRTYLGVTNNTKRRIRQHNGEIKGGAKATRMTDTWKYRVLIKNLTKSEALSYERTCKNLRRKGIGKTPVDRRISIMKKVIKNYVNDCDVSND